MVDEFRRAAPSHLAFGLNSEIGYAEVSARESAETHAVSIQLSPPEPALLGGLLDRLRCFAHQGPNHALGPKKRGLFRLGQIILGSPLHCLNHPCWSGLVDRGDASAETYMAGAASCMADPGGYTAPQS